MWRRSVTRLTNRCQSRLCQERRLFGPLRGRQLSVCGALRTFDVEEYTDDTLAEFASQPENPLGVHHTNVLSYYVPQDRLLPVDLGDDEWSRRYTVDRRQRPEGGPAPEPGKSSAPS